MLREKNHIERMVERKEVLRNIITRCLDHMGFYCDTLAEIVGIVQYQSITARELKKTQPLRNLYPTQAPDGTPFPLYHQHRNAFYRDRKNILTAMDIPSVNVTFNRRTVKVWGDAQAAYALLKGEEHTPRLPMPKH